MSSLGTVIELLDYSPAVYQYILSCLLSMSARDEQCGYEAIIKALTKSLIDIKGSPMDSLKPPTIDWNSSDQFKDFQLFTKGMESWYMET